MERTRLHLVDSLNHHPTLHLLERFRLLICERIGLFIDDTRLHQLGDVLKLFAAKHHLTCESYIDKFQLGNVDALEVQEIAKELVVTETYFFRNREQYEALIKLAVPDRLLEKNPNSPVRFLSAGCASGEEAYSISIALHEHFLHAIPSCEIYGVDINPEMLEKARLGRYTSWSLRDTDSAARERWFKRIGEIYRIDDWIRSSVSFESCNLASDHGDLWQPERFDVIFCRNVLMYFSPEKARSAIARLARALVPGGYLFLGHAETLRGLSTEFHLLHSHGTFFYQRKLETQSVNHGALAPGNCHSDEKLKPDAAWIETIKLARERIFSLPLKAPNLDWDNSASTHDCVTDQTPDLQQTMELLHHERFDEVLQRIGALPMEQASDVDAMLLKAVSLIQRGLMAEAENVCRSMLERDELNAGAHYALALCREGLSDIRGAVEEDQIAAYLDPSFAMPRLHMGLLARRLGDHDLAKREMMLALALLDLEDSSRILFFGGGFKREALIAICKSQLSTNGER